MLRDPADVQIENNHRKPITSVAEWKRLASPAARNTGAHTAALASSPTPGLTATRPSACGSCSPSAPGTSTSGVQSPSERRSSTTSRADRATTTCSCSGAPPMARSSLASRPRPTSRSTVTSPATVRPRCDAVPNRALPSESTTWRAPSSPPLRPRTHRLTHCATNSSPRWPARSQTLGSSAPRTPRLSYTNSSRRSPTRRSNV